MVERCGKICWRSSVLCYCVQSIQYVNRLIATVVERCGKICWRSYALCYCVQSIQYVNRLIATVVERCGKICWLSYALCYCVQITTAFVVYSCDQIYFVTVRYHVLGCVITMTATCINSGVYVLYIRSSEHCSP